MKNKQSRLDLIISELERKLSRLQAALPYADGQQYFRDKDAISELRADLSYWTHIREQLSSAEETTIISEEAANDLPQLVREQAL